MKREHLKEIMDQIEAIEVRLKQIKGRIFEHLLQPEVGKPSGPDPSLAPLPNNTDQSADHPILALIKSTDFRVTRSAKKRFMMVLSKLAEIKQSEFDQVKYIRGRSRVYFAERLREISDSGNNTFPERIPGTNFYVATNLSNARKSKIIEEVLIQLGESRGLASFVAARVDPNRDGDKIEFSQSRYVEGDNGQI